MRAQLAEPRRDPTSGAGRRRALPPSRLLPVGLLIAAGLAMAAGAQPPARSGWTAQRVDSESQPVDPTSASRFAASGTAADGDVLLLGNDLLRGDLLRGEDAFRGSSPLSGNGFTLGAGAGTDQGRTGTPRAQTTTAEPGRDVFGWLGDQVAPETKAALADPNKLLTDQSKAFIVLDTPPAIWANAVRLGSLPQALPIGVRDAFSTGVGQTLFNRPILTDHNADTAAKLLANTINQYGTEAIFGGVQNHLRTTRATDGTLFYPQWLRQQKFQSGLAGWNSLIGAEIVAANGRKPSLAEPLGLPTPTGRNADGQPQFATDADWWKNEVYDVAAFNVPITTTLIPKMLGDSATNAAVAATQLRAAGAADTLVGSKIALDYATKVDAPTPQQVLKRAVGIFLITGGNKLGSDLLSNSPPALKPYLGEISRNLDELNDVDPSLMSSGFNSYVSIPFNVVKGFWSFADGVTSQLGLGSGSRCASCAKGGLEPIVPESTANTLVRSFDRIGSAATRIPGDLGSSLLGAVDVATGTGCSSPLPAGAIGWRTCPGHRDTRPGIRCSGRGRRRGTRPRRPHRRRGARPRPPAGRRRRPGRRRRTRGRRRQARRTCGPGFNGSGTRSGRIRSAPSRTCCRTDPSVLRRAEVRGHGAGLCAISRVPGPRRSSSSFWGMPPPGRSRVAR